MFIETTLDDTILNMKASFKNKKMRDLLNCLFAQGNIDTPIFVKDIDTTGNSGPIVTENSKNLK